jgi:hypothetical protein
MTHAARGALPAERCALPDVPSRDRATARALRQTNSHMRFAWLALVVLVACTHDVKVKYPAPPDAPTGTLVLRFTSAADVSVAVNGLLVVDDEKTDKVVIENLPVGGNDVVIAANGGDKAIRAFVTSDQWTTIPMGVPEPSTGFLKSVFATLISIVAYSLLN